MNKFTFQNGAPGAGDTVVFAGDSITYGYNASDPANRWTTLLCAYYGCTEDNKGVNGKRVDNFDFTTIPAKTASIKYLFVALGINDLFEASISAANYYTTYQTKLEYLHNTKGYDYDDIILVTPYYVNDPEAYNTYTGGTLVKHLAFRQKVYDLALLKGCTVADAYGWMLAQPNPNSLIAGATDYIHPNDAGYAVIADYFETAAVTLVNSAIVRWADLNSVTTISNGSWLQAIAESVGITEPTNGSYLQALAEYAGATEPVNGSWLIALCNALSITTPVNGSWWEALATSGTFVTTDPDADAFIAAAGITDPVQQAALDTLVVGLKAVSLWSKCYAIYPMVGGSATSHKFNLKNPLDTDGAYCLKFQGGWTHSANGAKPNGTTGSALTHISPATVLSLDNTHLSFYNRTAGAGLVDMGSYDAVNYELFLCYNYAGTRYISINSTGTAAAQTAGVGFLIGSRSAIDKEYYYLNGTELSNNLKASKNLPTNSIRLGSYTAGDGSADQFSSRECAFCTIGEGLNPTEAASLYTLVQAFNTTLGRNV